VLYEAEFVFGDGARDEMQIYPDGNVAAYQHEAGDDDEGDDDDDD
jgi:hypothetical protein